MAGANFPRIKTWVSTEEVTYSDLNAEFDNILNNLTAAMVDDFSSNVSQMQSTTDPGEVGTESLATSVAGELARLRFLINEITGEDEWYESPVSSLAGLANAIGTGLTDNRLVSGRILTTSSQPAFLVPNGAARTVKLDGTPTSFIYYVNGIEYSIITDTTLTGLTAAPSSNNTCLINDAVAADQYWTKHAGEDGFEIPVDNMGTEITGLVGKFAAFKLDNGASTEYFIAYVASTTSLTKARRGYFFDSVDAAIPRITYANNDTITLMKLTWVFAKTDLTLTATYNPPVWSKDEPSSPALGDYWFDLANNTWKVYGVGSYASAGAVLVGTCIQDTTNTVAARSFEFFANYSDENTVELNYLSATQVQSRNQGGMVNVWGSSILCDHNLRTWDITIDRDSGVSESASTFYYFYMTQAGDVIISDVKPHDRREDLGGYYHTHQSWRCLGRAFNNSSSDLTDVASYYQRYNNEIVRSVAAADVIQRQDKFILLSGASSSQYLPDAAKWRGESLILTHAGTSLSQVYTLIGYGGTQTVGGIASGSYALYTNGETLEIYSDGSNWQIKNHFTNTTWIAFPSVAAGTLITGTGGNPAYGTVATNAAYWRRSGKDIAIRWDYRTTALGSAAAGTGLYLFNLPSGLVIDTTFVTVNTATTYTTAFSDSESLGTISIIFPTTATVAGAVSAYSTTQLKAQGLYSTSAASNVNVWGPSMGSFGSATLMASIKATLPIVGFQP